MKIEQRSLRVMANKDFRGTKNYIFSNSENRPHPSMKEPSLYINRIFNSATAEGLNIFNNYNQQDSRQYTKMRDPYHLSPLNFTDKEFTILSDNTIAVWTDGSQREIEGKPKTGWGVAFSSDSVYYTWIRTNCSHNNLQAELEAIEFAISRVPTIHPVTIFTDSLSSIRILQGPPPRLSSPEYDFHLQITRMPKLEPRKVLQ